MIRNVVLTFSTELACIGINFIIGVLLARFLSPNDRGIMMLVMTFPLFSLIIFNLGLHEAIVFFYSRKRIPIETVLGNVLITGCIISLASVTLLILTRNILLTSFLSGLPGEYYIPLIALVPVGIIIGIFQYVLRAKEQFTLLNFIRFIGYLFLLIALGISIICLHSGLNGAVIAFITTSTLNLVLTMITVLKYVKPSLALNRNLSGEILRYGLKSYLQIIFESLNYRLDLFLIAWFLDPEQVAFYGLATSLAELGLILPNSVSSVLFARLSNTPISQVHQLTAEACRITMTINGILVMLLLSICWFFVPLVYGEVYQPAVPALIILLPGILAAALHKVLNRNFSSRNRQQFPIISSLTSLIIIILFNLWLIPQWGINGAAFVSSLGYSIASLILFIFFARDSKLALGEILFVQKKDLVSYWNLVKRSINKNINTEQI